MRKYKRKTSYVYKKNRSLKNKLNLAIFAISILSILLVSIIFQDTLIPFFVGVFFWIEDVTEDITVFFMQVYPIIFVIGFIVLIGYSIYRMIIPKKTYTSSGYS